MQFAAAAARNVFGNQRDVLRGQQTVTILDVACADVHAPGVRSGKHVGAAEELGLVFRRTRSGGIDVLQKKFKGFGRVAPVERHVGFPGSLGHHVVAHAADAFARMPQGDRDAGAEQCRNTGVSAAKMKVPGLQQDRVFCRTGVRGDGNGRFNGLR